MYDQYKFDKSLHLYYSETIQNRGLFFEDGHMMLPPGGIVDQALVSCGLVCALEALYGLEEGLSLVNNHLEGALGRLVLTQARVAAVAGGGVFLVAAIWRGDRCKPSC